MRYSGIFPALVTPFDEKGKINGCAIQNLIDHLIEQGVSGFYICGSSGESYLLSMAERKYLIDAVSEAINGRVKLIANIGMFATEHGIDLAEYAEKKGADAISSVPPFYFHFTMDDYYQYYKDLAESVSIPLLLYNVPALSGVKLTAGDIERLINIPGVMGMKHTSYDLFHLQMLIKKYPDKTFFIGHDELFINALPIGVTAGIGTSFNFMAEKFITMIKAFNDKDMKLALKLQNEANEVIDVLCQVGVFNGTKAILRMQGFDCGVCRKPFQPLSREDMMKVREAAIKNHLLL